MSSFKLTIVCPDGCLFDGDAEFIRLRTTGGDVGILPNHIAYAAAIGMGECAVQFEGKKRYDACIGGMITVADNVVSVITTTFEWKDEIDLPRAKAALKRAEEKLASEDITEAERKLFEAKRRRALVRISVAEKKE